LALSVLDFVVGQQRAVLFDNDNAREFVLLNPSSDGDTVAYYYYRPVGTLTLRNNSMPRLAATRSTIPSFGRFSGIVAPLRRIDQLPSLPADNTLAIDVEYSFVLNDSTGQPLAAINHGTTHILLLTNDEDSASDPRGLAIEYGGGNLLVPPDASWGNWSEPRVNVWRFDTIDVDGIKSGPLPLTPTAARGVLVRAGRFRLRARYRLTQQTLEFEQLSLSVENSANFTGLLLHFHPPADPWRSITATRWLLRNTTNPPRILLFGTRTDFDVDNLIVTAEPFASAPSFNSTWLAPPPTAAPTTVTTARPTPQPTPRPTFTLPTLPTAVMSSASTSTLSGSTTTTGTSSESSTTNATTSTQTTTSTTTSTRSISDSATSSTSIAATSVATDPVPTDRTEVVSMGGADEMGADQTTIIAAAVAVPTILLCLVLVYLALRKTHRDGDGKHGGAQVLSTRAASQGVEMVTSRAEDTSVRNNSDYGMLPGARSTSQYADHTATVSANSLYDQLTPVEVGLPNPA
jgi:hypothetical protein